MRYLLLHNSRNREELISRMIVSQLYSIDKSADIYVTYWAEQTNNIKDIIDFSPDVLLTFPFTISDLIEEISAIKKVCRCKVCTYTTEGYASENDIRDYYMGFYDYPRDLIDLYLFFGPQYEKVYIEAQKNKHRFGDNAQSRSVGYPLYELDRMVSFRNEYPSINKICDLSKNYEKVVTVLSGFQGADKTIEQIRRSNDAYNSFSENKEDEIQKAWDFYRRIAEYRDLYYKNIVTLAQNNKDCLFVIKLHPIEIASVCSKTKALYSELERVENIIVLRELVPLAFLLEISFCMIHYGSTASVEAYIHGVPSVYFRGYICEVLESDYRFEMCNVEEVDKLLKSHVEAHRTVKKDEFVFGFFNYKDGMKYQPSKLIAEELHGMAIKEKVEYDDYVDYGYYKRLYRAYLLMAAKRYVLLKWNDAHRYIMMRKTIENYIKPLW